MKGNFIHKFNLVFFPTHSKLSGSQHNPTVITDRDVVELEKDKYLLFSCISYIHHVSSFNYLL